VKPLTLDNIISAATHFFRKWSPASKHNQSFPVLRKLICKLYGASQGFLFNARIRCSQAAIAAELGLTREWVNKLIKRLSRWGWIIKEAPRLPDGKQEVTTFRAGGMLKRLFVMLLKSRECSKKNRVNSRSQSFPTKEEVEKNKALLSDLISDLSQKFGTGGEKRRY
jgi:hypothetical protein